MGLVAALPLIGPSLSLPSDPNILDMLDAGKLGSPSLFPVQRFILKVMYGLELDRAERGYRKFLKDSGRYVRGREGTQETVLIMGRRTGKTILSQTVQMYELTKLMGLSDDPSRPRTVLSLSNDRDQAGLLFNAFTEFVVRSPLKERITSNTMSCVNFEDDAGKKVQARFKSAAIRGIRGIRPASVILDEAAYYESLEQVYDAIGPYRTRLTTLTTSDGSKRFRKFYNQAEKRGALIMRIPTWEANPFLPRDYGYLKELRGREGAGFDLEFGAEV